MAPTIRSVTDSVFRAPVAAAGRGNLLDIEEYRV
jgi:hypothetical protein